MKRFTYFQRVIAVALAAATLTPLSGFAETRRLSQTDFCTSRRTTPLVYRGSTVMSADAVLAAMNEERRRRGLGSLRFDARLNAAAADRARDMFGKGYFNHVSPEGMEPFVWVTYRDYRYATVGENLAEGYRDARGVVDGWMNSPGHRANILGRSFEDVGLAIVHGSPDRRTNGYTVVALYGREAWRPVRLASR